MKKAGTISTLHNPLKIFPHQGRLNFWLTVLTGISDPRLCLAFDVHSLHGVNEMKTPLDLQKRFPIFHACPKCLAALLCGSASLKNGLAFLQELDEV